MIYINPTYRLQFELLPILQSIKVTLQSGCQWDTKRLIWNFKHHIYIHKLEKLNLNINVKYLTPTSLELAGNLLNAITMLNQENLIPDDIKKKMELFCTQEMLQTTRQMLRTVISMTPPEHRSSVKQILHSDIEKPGNVESFV